MPETNLQAATIIDQALPAEDDQQELSVENDLEEGEELEDELIIEDFTIDGICGVY